MDRVDDTLRNIDSTLAVCEPSIERALACPASIEADRDAAAAAADRAGAALARAQAAVATPEPGPWRSYWRRYWQTLRWLVLLEWLPERAPTGRGIVVLSDTPVVPISHTDPDHPPAPVND
jgi:hypothetical protein